MLLSFWINDFYYSFESRPFKQISNLAIKRGLGEYDIYVKNTGPPAYSANVSIHHVWVAFNAFLDGSHIDKNLFVAPSAVVIIDFSNSIIYKSVVFYYLSNSGYFKNFYFIFFQPY